MREIERFSAPVIEAYWPSIQEQLEFIPHTWTHMTLESMRERALGGALHIWGIGKEDGPVKLVVMSQFALYDVGLMLQVIHAFGEGIDEFLPQINAVMEKYAHDNGCLRIEVLGRRGWIKKLAPLGFEVDCVILTRKVRDWRLQ